LRCEPCAGQQASARPFGCVEAAAAHPTSVRGRPTSSASRLGLVNWPPPAHLWIGTKSRLFLPSHRRAPLADSAQASRRALGTRPELRTRNVAAQTGIVSVAEIRPGPGNLCDLSKG